MSVTKHTSGSNKALGRLPGHLLDLIIEQPYNSYTTQDHALWRYVMRRNVNYLRDVAHESYVEGLGKTGISVEEIPHIGTMNRALRKMGWAAATVDGFVPPSAFMEFQANKVLVIAADIRPIEQINYTPAPDIIHEAAGHAPIIANQEYAQYLSLIGWVGSKALSSKRDYDIYEAIRHLSILKADPYSPAKDVELAELRLQRLEESVGEPSEITQIRNLHWWTVEYGLIGDVSRPKIYGAGLLSSIGESYNCLKAHVKKIPYTLDAKNYEFDITKEQPQLFVTPDFAHLTTVLREYEATMALRKGGLEGVEKAIGSGQTATCVYTSGLQVSGTFTEVRAENGRVDYLKTLGPTTLNFQDRQLEGHGKDYHAEGFGSAVGLLRNSSKPLESFTDEDFRDHGISRGEPVRLEYKSGVTVEGLLREILRKDDRILVMSFDSCTVRQGDQTLFQPNWGTYDMAVGQKIDSVFAGPADPAGFGLGYAAPEEKTHKIQHDDKSRRLHSLYQRIRDYRSGSSKPIELEETWMTVRQDYPKEWLLPLEIYEASMKDAAKKAWIQELRDFLEGKKEESEEMRDLINNGLELIQ
jgi:phenylalanine-4-hydroxylase